MPDAKDNVNHDPGHPGCADGSNVNPNPSTDLPMKATATADEIAHVKRLGYTPVIAPGAARVKAAK